MQVLRNSCDGFLAPALFVSACREDCVCSQVGGCSDASALDLRVPDMSGSCGTVQEAGTYPILNASWTSGGTTMTSAYGGWIRFAAFPPSPGPVTGDYSLTFPAADGGAALSLGGTFCIQH